MGLAHMLGFKLPINFNMPYFAANITEFWRRWHISLSSWLRDYLYIPLGGSRQGRLATYRNLFLTMLLGGLWHGANWTFVFWGAYHGLLLAIHRALRGEREAQSDAPNAASWGLVLGVVGTFLTVCIGWVFFRAQTFADAGTMLTALAWPTAGKHLDLASRLLVWACFALVLLGHIAGSRWQVHVIWRRWPAPALGGALAALLLIALLLMPETSQGFIYFQF
jgi:alginate O-acetyltransferase complex protein AlgI